MSAPRSPKLVSRRWVVFEADDLGLCEAVNEGVRAAARHGILTSVSVTPNGDSFKQALEILKEYPALGVGVHLNLLEGRSLLPDTLRAPFIIKTDGSYRRSFFYFLTQLKKDKILRAAESEFRSQIEAVLKHVRIDHLNSHRHLHALPGLFDLACRLAREYGIPFIRLPRERQYRNSIFTFSAKAGFLGRLSEACAKRLPEGLARNDYYIGLSYCGQMDWTAASDGLAALPQENLIAEVVFHPSAPGASACARHPWNAHRDRVKDYETLADVRWHAWLGHQNFQRTNYRNLAPGH